MERQSRTRTTSSAATKIIALLLVLCFVQCATGSCLSYGHSCWGAHGKRSGKLPSAAPDWYLTRMLRRMAENAEMNQDSNLPTRNNDLNALFRGDLDDTPSTDKMADKEGSIELPFSRNFEGKPMLDDNFLSKLKMWQILRDTSDEK